MKFVTLLLIPAALFAGQTRYARLGDFEGKVEVQLTAADYWMPAGRNLPLPESAWVRTGPEARVEIEMDDGGVWRLGPNSQGELSDYTRISTGQRVTTLSLDHGLAYFTGAAKGKDALTLALPGAQVIFRSAASVRLQAEDTWSEIAILDGSARFSSPAAELDLSRGQTTRVEPANPARFFLYREVSALDLDRWSAARDHALASPAAALHVAQQYGSADLDAAGAWVASEDLGTVWKPKVAEGWIPFRDGRWRWYGALGYTWASDDSWGWLPYHYGRWARSKTLGWVWVPSASEVFKPGEVFWLKGAGFAAWGPLAPGEQWAPPQLPEQFLNLNMTYASFDQDAEVIDPAGYSERPKEPLKVAAFALALPSPAFLVSRLDAVRPPTRAGSTRIMPVLPGTTFQSITELPAPPARPATASNRPQPPAVSAQPAPQDPPAPEQILVPVPVEGIVVVDRPVPAKLSPAKPSPAKPAPQILANVSTQPPPRTLPPSPSAPPGGVRHTPPGRKPRDQDEQEMYNRVLKELNTNPAKAVEDLNTWSKRYQESDFADVRQVYYMQAYSRLNQPASVLQYGAEPMTKDLTAILDPGETLSVLYLITANVRGIPKANREQIQLGKQASRRLIEYLPEYFRETQRPRETTPAQWTQMRTEIETLARDTLQALGERRGL
jgi:hypothetical protein